jgi:hypothetical protein
VPLSHDVLSNKVGCGHTPPPSPVNSGRVTCKKERWLPIATGLRSDFHLVRGRGHPSKTGRDIRSGNPRETTQVRLGPIAAPRAPNRLKFEYEYVVGYGRWGANVPRTVRGPSFTVSVTDAKDSKSDVVVYRSPVLDTYDYDTVSLWTVVCQMDASLPSAPTCISSGQPCPANVYMTHCMAVYRSATSTVAGVRTASRGTDATATPCVSATIDSLD